MKTLLLSLFFSITLLSVSQAEVNIEKNRNGDRKISPKSVSIRLDGPDILAFNGIPLNKGWGKDLVYAVNAETADKRTMGPLGGIPLVDIWNKDGGIAVFNTKTYQEPFSVTLSLDAEGVRIDADGGTQIEVYKHSGDYFEAVREFALRMKKKGLYVRPAPEWAFDPIWETYGYEEDFDIDTIKAMVPILKELGIKTITIDSGWYGIGRGEDHQFNTGDFIVNPDVIGSEKDWVDLIDYLHRDGFRVRIWWIPGVAEEGSDLWKNHPDWFTEEVVSSTGETEDIYLDPNNHEVRNWMKALVERFLSYGVDGFKQDDIYHYVSGKAKDRQVYAELINNNLAIAQFIRKDFVINTCNCGIAQNFYQISGQNQLITSDPVGSKQFRHRAKYLHAVNVNNAAVLGDHVELSQGDVGPEEMEEPGFYDDVDFESIVPLGMVLQTKFRNNPGPLYKKWFQIYDKYKFYKMEWINIPIQNNRLEAYLMKDNRNLYFSFFIEDNNSLFDGKVRLIHLIPGIKYKVFNLVDDTAVATFTAKREWQMLQLKFKERMVIGVAPVSI